ncbi:MAG: ABC transporter substrate-binding protein, partial [Acidimicrobiales bacterium]
MSNSNVFGNAADRSFVLSRRDVLKLTGSSVAFIMAGGALNACASRTATSPTIGHAKRGGVLTAGLTGGSSLDTLAAEIPVSDPDFARNSALYDPLIKYGRNGELELVLAEEITPNKDGTMWTIRVRPGVTFHDGKDLTSDDVLYTLQYIMNPKNPMPASTGLTLMNLKDARKLDAVTLAIPMLRPMAVFPSMLAWLVSIIPTDYSPKTPVGTGPFKFDSFTPGVSSTFLRYPDYWDSPLPYVDKLIITDYPDETSQVNALAAGTIDLANLLSPSSIPEVSGSGGKICVSNGGGFTPFTMRVDVPPFNNPLVREAFRLVVDREEMRKLVFGGHGVIGNDIFSIFDPLYDHSIPQRVQDIPKAKYLLGKAGYDGMTVTLNTTSLAQGATLAAQVFAQQASKAGIKVNIDSMTSTNFFGPGYLQYTFAQDVWYFDHYLQQVAGTFVPGSPYNECHWNDPHYTSLYNS